MTTLLLSVALKGTLVLGLAWTADRLSRRASAAARHGVWAAAFGALLLLPVLEAAGPVWSVPVLPSSTPPVAEAEAGLTVMPLPPAAAAPEALPPPPPVPATLDAAALPQPVRADADARRLPALYGSESAPLWLRLSFADWLLGLWSMGALLVAARWLAAFAAAYRLVAAAREQDDDGWRVLAERARRRVGAPTSVRLLRSDHFDVPIAWGYGPTAVVLPTSAEAWSSDQREAVLLHEMAHLRRRDAWTQGVAQAALALHWFNPLAWTAYRAFLGAREQACDDAALAGGTRPSSYAAHLVRVARGVRREPLSLAAVAPMARPNALEGRVLSVLDAERRRGPVGRLRLFSTVLLALGVLTPLAAFRPAEQATALLPSTAFPQPAPTGDRLGAHAAEGEVGEAQEQLQLALRQVEDVHRRVEAAHLRIGQAGTPEALTRARADLDAAQHEWVAVQDTLSAAQEAIQKAVMARLGLVSEGEPPPAAFAEGETLAELEAAVRQAVGPAPIPRPRPPAVAVDPPQPAPAVDWDAVDRARRAALRRSLR